jgi:iron complex outermembrane receptor protein
MQLMDDLSSEVGYSYTKIDYDLPNATRPTIGYDSVNRQLFTKLNYQLSEQHSIFATLRAENSSTYNTDNYTAVDLTWNWKINNNWATAVSGKNLFAGSHIEYANTRETFTVPNYIDECVTFSVSATF